MTESGAGRGWAIRRPTIASEEGDYEQVHYWRTCPGARHLWVGHYEQWGTDTSTTGELRIVDKNPLNWVSIVYNVFEHLMELDKDGTLVPRLATGWRWLDDRTLEVTLRQGVTFHNGEVFDAEIVKLNWEENTRLRQPCRPGHF